MIMITNEKLIVLGFVKLKDILEVVELLIKKFKSVRSLRDCIYIKTCIYTFDREWIRENAK